MHSKKLLLTTAALLCATFSQQAMAREQIRSVGSSTVYPFVTSAAEEFGSRNSQFKTPIVESTGTGGGFRLFCSGTGVNTPDIANASRHILASEVELCKSNGVNKIVEIKLGSDGIVLANSVHAPLGSITIEQLFLALARNVPSEGKLIPNPYKKWSDIDPSLPNKAIEVYGPPPTSGTRDAFVEIVMEKGCASLPEYNAAFSDETARKRACHLIREDGAFIEAGENDNLIVQKINSNHNAYGIFGYSYLEQNGELVHAALINNVEPTFETISDGSYSIARPLYIYVKGEHVSVIPGIREFVDEILSDRATGLDGYLVYKGLVPLEKADHDTQRDSALEQLK
jgi:phosphate transport system substrate-binding protein